MNATDVRVIEPGESPRLTQQSLARLRVQPALRVEDLQRDLAIELLVISGVDTAHPAFTDDTGDTDMTESTADELHIF
ncbi:MAG TPA: hypothetical protein VJZ00_11855 [Thermoanaerobaculia bacterium]|nr:hypothetical protein [Thermoanaerobaculia bacterium]